MHVSKGGSSSTVVQKIEPCVHYGKLVQKDISFAARCMSESTDKKLLLLLLNVKAHSHMHP
jgi:hypothetical protein